MALSHFLEIDGVGRFEFRRRSIRNDVSVEAECSRITGGQSNLDAGVIGLARMIAYLSVMTIEAPSDWDLDALDPDDQASYDRLLKVYRGVQDAEAGFRPRVGHPRARKGSDDIVPVRVSEVVGPGPD